MLIDDLLRRSEAGQEAAEDQIDLFADFNGLPTRMPRPSFTSTTPTGRTA